MGNGRLGFTVFGDPDLERIQFNEDSLWVGNEHHTGGYQPFGDIYVELGHASYTNYHRELDISRALQTVEYESDGVKYKREYFASYPAQVSVVRFTADRNGALSGVAWLESMHRSGFAAEQGHSAESMAAIITEANDRTLTLKAETKDLFWWKVVMEKGLRGREYVSKEIINLDYEAQVLVLNDGGKVSVDGDRIVFDKCDSMTLLLAADTNYINDREKGWRGEHPHARVTRTLEEAAAKDYEELLQAHVADYKSLYDRFAIDLGKTSGERLTRPTAERVASYEPGSDPDIEELMYRYARYLMISCSRPGHGGLPANLQGLWLFHIRPAWLCDYHTDINLQMNYWFVDQANLSECFIPLAEWLDSIREVRKEETRKVLGIERGWLMRSENGIFGGSTYHFQKGDSAWIGQNLWDHYAFTQDKDYLRRYAYPIMKEVSHFWLDHLKQIPDPRDPEKTVLVVPDGRSPEHGPARSDGVSYDQQLCWDLFNNTIEAAEALSVDKALRTTLAEKRDKLLGPQVGKWGQLQEWMADIDDPKSKHRHVSHMLAVYPGRQIHPTITPRFAEAAKVSVIARGNGRTGWSKVFKSCVFARLLEAEHAYRLAADVLKSKTHGNLWTTHPPFQIDCNFGYAAAVNEMLVQSHLQGQMGVAGERGDYEGRDMRVIHLLPALPKAWADGSVRGMQLRGGYELDMEWKNGALTSVKLHGVSNDDAPSVVRYGEKRVEVSMRRGRAKEIKASDFVRAK